ncbi:hypothetical protein AGMMS50255_5760 [Spirochaetia bacterium]|nr:hypothetical protein AGMMS50255_5760 [Spirochaetia bacterium]
MNGPAMKKESEDIGRGYKANCWCTHGCWIMSSLNFNPRKMITKIISANGEVKRLKKPVNVDENALRALEAKYHLDTAKLAEIEVIQGVKKAGAA